MAFRTGQEFELGLQHENAKNGCLLIPQNVKERYPAQMNINQAAVALVSKRIVKGKDRYCQQIIMSYRL